MKKRKICIVTGSRAEYGLLFWLMKRLKSDSSVSFQLAVTGSHLSVRFGSTYRQIIKDGFKIHAKVPILSGDDSPRGVTRSLAKALDGFADVFNRLKPDLLVVLGDRYEILAAVEAAFLAGIPVAHIAGGDVTEGVLDDAMRHSITKMSHLHFVTNERAVTRVRQLGEGHGRIFNVGNPGLDWIRRTKLLGRAEFERAAGFSLRQRNLLVTFHPETLSVMTPEVQLDELLKALRKFDSKTGFLISTPNADAGGLKMMRLLNEFTKDHPNAKLFASMGQKIYLSAMCHVDAVVGNSSSGLYEAPSFKIPTVNIGDRQKGRLKASSVIDCRLQGEAIFRSVKAALLKDCSLAKNPYGDGRSSDRIYRRLNKIRDYRALLKKSFCDISER